MRELELKFAADHEFVMPIPEVLIESKAGVGGVRELPTSDLRTTYWDTKDLRLARASVSLRYRRGEDEGPRWTLKLPIPGHDATSRNELHFEGDAMHPPADALDLATAYVRNGSLGPVAEVNTKRHRLQLLDGSGAQLAELDDDVVSVQEGSDLRGQFREIELESKGADEKGLERVGSALVQAGARRSEPIPKVVRALGTRATAPPDVLEIVVAPSDPASQAVRATLAAAIGTVVINDARARMGDVDGIHKMRVGFRRLRSNLQTFRPLISPSWAEHLTVGAKGIFDALGTVRDLDVMNDRISRLAVGMNEGIGDITALIGTRRVSAMEDLLEILRDRKYVDFLDELVAAVHAPILTSLAATPSSDALGYLVADSWKRLHKSHRRLNRKPTLERFHDVRKKTKRMRYAVEASSAGLTRKRAERAVVIADRCKVVQDVLGEMQDVSVLSGALQDIAGETRDQGTIFAAGRIAERAQARLAVLPQEFEGVWERLERETHRKWLENQTTGR
jgi:CHAD domain-containing protein